MKTMMQRRAAIAGVGRRIAFRVFAIAAMLVPPASVLHAQQPHEQDRDSLLHVAEHSNWYVRLTTPARTLEGRGLHVTRDSVWLRESRVARNDIIAIDRRIRRNGGGMPGGLFGAAAMGIFTYSLYKGFCEGSCGSGTGALIGGAGMGFAVGSAIGSLVAPGKPEWHPQYPSTSAPSPIETPADTATQPDVTGTLTISAGGGLLVGTNGDGTAIAKRLALQLEFPSSANSRTEFAAEAYADLLDDDGFLGITIGPNFTTKGQSYFGFSAGAAAVVDDYVYDIGVRVGHRPGNHGMLRPEARADVFWRNGETVLSITASLGLQTR